MEEFEFDPNKSAANRDKHGIDFIEAQRLWVDGLRVEVPARTVDEARWLVIGRIDGKHWSAVVTFRQGKVRIISVRRSREEEVAIYEG
ncbi:BrnT family toxin [Pseudonocardia nigra]|uniref:BrnT family toxin n=1 Tax=Pseudonocardia nigra TaxID=1921578 RepID=UPI001C5F5414|nr:BrnT family toxin [Pseudonocardia nigra]